MDKNVIYMSDSSFDLTTKEAGLAIKNLSTGETHTCFVHAQSCMEAEEFALLEAISHAIEHGHLNCVFIYDSLAINTKLLQEFYKNRFDCIQFMWFKREYVSEVDQLARKVRLKNAINPPLIKYIRSLQLHDDVLITALMRLTKGETYGYLCALSGTAPIMKSTPSRFKEVNEKIISLLMHTGSQELKYKLAERFGHHRFYKFRCYDELLQAAGFDESWIDAAAKECAHHLSAA